MTALTQAIVPAIPRRVLLACGGAALALASSLVLGITGYLALLALLVFGLVATISSGMQFAKPTIGIGLLVATAVALPIEFRGPAGVMMSTSLPLATALCTAWFVRTLLGRHVSLDRSRAALAAIAFMAGTLVSFVTGLVPLFPTGGAPVPAQVAQLGIFLVSACLFLAVGHQVVTVAQLRTITWILVAAGLVACVFQMVEAARPIARWTTRPGSVGSAFWTWLVVVAASQAIFNRRLGGGARLALLGIAGLALGHGLFQVRTWASGWVPPLVGLGVLVLVRMPRLSIAVGLVGLPIGLYAWTQLSSTLLAEEGYSLMTRREAWHVLWNVIERSPVLGSGPANYYYYTENFPILGWYVRFISHNQYQDLLAQTGILGCVLFAWLAIELAWLAGRVYRRAPEGFERAYAVGALAGLAGTLASGMLGDWLIPFYYNAGILGFRSSLLFWVFLGGVLALHRMLPADGARPDVRAVARAY